MTPPTRYMRAKESTWCGACLRQVISLLSVVRAGDSPPDKSVPLWKHRIRPRSTAAASNIRLKFRSSWISIKMEDQLSVYFCNIVCSFHTSHPIDLRLLCSKAINVVYEGQHNLVRMDLTNPKIFASIWPSGKIVCAGAQLETEAYSNAKYVAKLLKNLGFEVKMRRYRVVNVMASCKLPYKIDLQLLARNCDVVSYEPEIQPGAVWKMDELNAAMTIFNSGNMTIFSRSCEGALKAVEKFLVTTGCPVAWEWKERNTQPS